MTPIPEYFNNGNFHYIEQSIIGMAMYFRSVCLDPDVIKINQNAPSAIQYALEKDEVIASGHLLIQAQIPYDTYKYNSTGNLIDSVFKIYGSHGQDLNLPSCNFRTDVRDVDVNLFPMPVIPDYVNTCEKYLVWAFLLWNRSLIIGAREAVFSEAVENANTGREIIISLADNEQIILINASLPFDYERWVYNEFLPECAYQVAVREVNSHP